MSLISHTFFCWVFLFGIYLIPWHASAQKLYRIGAENGDCQNAIELLDTVFGPTTPPLGPGSVPEFNSTKHDLYSFEQEHHTVWYIFEALDDCDLLLEVVPLSVKDDYDFILFRYEGDNTCADIRERKIIPVRSCISRNDTLIKSRTGLSYSAKDDFIHSGPGPSFSRPLPMKKGERYLLVLDNVYSGGDGHHLYLKYGNCRKPEPAVQVQPSNYLNLTVRESGTIKPVAARITLIDKSATGADADSVIWEDSSSIFTKMKRSAQYQLLVQAPGYFQFSDIVKTGADFQTYLKTVNLVPIKEGKKVSFSNILFVGGSDQFLRESYPVLEDIIQTLKDQPGIEIDIIGHVNEPYNNRSGKSTAENQTLSEKRAFAVYQYLIRKGIASSRLSWQGKGSTEMVYPYASTEDQMQANRRVELYIKKYSSE
ncbi:MAG TPA: OmpA family protein [Bacteroidales bacterium]|nr:OmpA family protein [Bacteroidales bacterium]HRZ48883.1 OmpA family protein [Bacteroidales bacterium]